MLVRQATLEDAVIISELYRSHISTWQDQSGNATEYEALSLYERWSHGGPWMSLETCSVWLAHLLQDHDGIPLVAQNDAGEIVGQAEVFIWHEEAPFGHHINISTLCVRADQDFAPIGTAIVNYVLEMAAVIHCDQITIAYPNPIDFYEDMGFTPLQERFLIQMPVEEGRVFYKARELTDDGAGQIERWFMPLGRFQNAREEWERMRWRIWRGVPGLVEAEWQRLYIDITGQPGILHLHQQDDDLASATARLWTKRAVTSHIITAVLDRAARLGYQRVTTLVDATLRASLHDAEDIADANWLYAKRLKP